MQRLASAVLLLCVTVLLIGALVAAYSAGDELGGSTASAQHSPAVPAGRPDEVVPMSAPEPGASTATSFPTYLPVPLRPPPTLVPTFQGKLDAIEYFVFGAPLGQVSVAWQFDAWPRENLERYVATNRKQLEQMSGGDSIVVNVYMKRRLDFRHLRDIAGRYGLNVERTWERRYDQSGWPVTSATGGGPNGESRPPTVLPTTQPLQANVPGVIVAAGRLPLENARRLAADPRVYFLDVSREAVHRAVRQAVGWRPIANSGELDISNSVYEQLWRAGLVEVDVQPPPPPRLPPEPRPKMFAN